MPPKRLCTKEFILGVLQGTKKAFNLSEIKQRAVPFAKSATIESVVQKALKHSRKVADYLPNPTRKQGYVISQEFLYTVINTLLPRFFETEAVLPLRAAKLQSKQRDIVLEKKYFDMLLSLNCGDQSFLNISAVKPPVQ